MAAEHTHFRAGKAPSAGPRGNWKRYVGACGSVNGGRYNTARTYNVTCAACKASDEFKAAPQVKLLDGLF